jgi:hypothetical protein
MPAGVLWNGVMTAILSGGVAAAWSGIDGSGSGRAYVWLSRRERCGPGKLRNGFIRRWPAQCDHFVSTNATASRGFLGLVLT